MAPQNERKKKGNKDQLRGWLKGLPLVESLLLGVALEPLVLYDKAHTLVEGGGEGRRLLPQQDVNGGGDGVTELGALAGGGFAAFRVLAVHQAVYKNKLFQI